MTQLPGSASGPCFAVPHSPCPAPSLHEFRSGRGRLVRSLLYYFGQVRLLLRAHRRLRPPAFPTTSRARLAGTAMEISRFPCKRLLRMPGSTTTRGRHVSCDIDTAVLPSVGRKTSAPRTCLTPLNTSPAPSPVNASRLPSRTTRASLGASAVRYSFTVTDFHRLPFAGLPAHPSTRLKVQPNRRGGSGMPRLPKSWRCLFRITPHNA